jgi:8-hydroxy-5-deazaflavin:NADPH oxidoreductase
MSSTTQQTRSDEMMKDTNIAVIGGTGALGSGLVARFAAAGAKVWVGSRRVESAQASALEIANLIEQKRGTRPDIGYAANVEAAAGAEIIFLAVPFDQQTSTLQSIRDVVQGKVVVDTTVPLKPPKVATVNIPENGSAAASAQLILGSGCKVLSAFHNVAAEKLKSLEPLESDVLVFGDDKDESEKISALIREAGMRAYMGGPLANSIAAEALTSVLITINRQWKCHAGIRIVGAE